MIGSIKKFSNDVVSEMKKVSWPTKDQLKESTMIVVVVTLIIAGLVFGIDSIMTGLINLVF